MDANGPEGLAAQLVHAQSCLDQLWRRGSQYVNALGTLHERLSAGRLQVAVLGQFKRGKSTFLNALLGEPLLPTGVVPLTAIPTFIHWAGAGSIGVSFLDGRPAERQPVSGPQHIQEQLSRFVTEEGNPVIA